MAQFTTAEVRFIGRKRPLWHIILASSTITTCITTVVWFVSSTHAIHLDITTNPIGTILFISLVIQGVIAIILIILRDWKFQRKRQMENSSLVQVVRDGVLVKSIP